MGSPNGGGSGGGQAGRTGAPPATPASPKANLLGGSGRMLNVAQKVLSIIGTVPCIGNACPDSEQQAYLHSP